MRLIWAFDKAEYFSRKDWTGRFHLKRLANFAFRRNVILPRERRNRDESHLTPFESVRRANHHLPCHSGAMRQHRARNLEIPGSALRAAPE